MDIEGVIFDMDGVLTDTEPVHIESWLILFERKGIPSEGIDFETAIGKTDEQFLIDLRNEGRFEGDVKPLGKEKQEIYFDIHMDRFKPQPGAKEAVLAVAEKLPVGLATSDWRANASRSMAEMGLLDAFTTIVCRDDVVQSKPHPEIYVKAAAGLQVPPEKCVAVEDSASGIQAAQAAGLRCIAITASVPREWLEAADWIIGAMSEVVDIVLG